MQTLNKFGFSIRMACFSCEHAMESGRAKNKKCCLSDTEQSRKFLCDSWTMRKGLENAGKGNGRVKAPEYLAYIAKYHGDVKVDDLRKEYLSRNRSIYLDGK